MQVPVQGGSKSISVVVADDDPRFRRMIAAVLADEQDIRVIGEAGDGQRAALQVEALLPDVVLLDIKMPGGGGIAATQAIRRQAPSVSVVMLTGSDEDRDVRECLKAGASGYLLKQNFVTDLAGTIRAVAQHAGILLSSSVAAKVVDGFRQEANAAAGPNLTDREIEVLQLIALGRTNYEIANELFLSSHTVKRHVTNILGKLNERSRSDAVLHAVESGLLSLDVV